MDDGCSALWHSVDLRSWSRLGTLPYGLGGQAVGASASDGARLVVLTPDLAEGRLRASADGAGWSTVGQVPARSQAIGITPPSFPGAPWLIGLTTSYGDALGFEILTSADLRSWRTATFPTPLAEVVAEPWGWAAIGLTPTSCAPNPCPEPAPVLYKSLDGVAWTEWGGALPDASVPRYDWPTEFLLLGHPGEPTGALWRLTMPD